MFHFHGILSPTVSSFQNLYIKNYLDLDSHQCQALPNCESTHFSFEFISWRLSVDRMKSRCLKWKSTLLKGLKYDWIIEWSFLLSHLAWQIDSGSWWARSGLYTSKPRVWLRFGLSECEARQFVFTHNQRLYNQTR